MFKMPVCPYCHTVYRYGDVRKNKNKKIIECYHCKKYFNQKKYLGYAVLAVILVFIAVVINLIILNLTADFLTSIIPLIIVSVSAVIIFMIFNPFFVSYKKTKDNIKNEK